MHANNELISTTQKVLIYPALISARPDQQVYFLFSLRQVEDILMDVTVKPIPSSPSYVDGIAEWRSCTMPVISLDAFWEPNHITSHKTRQLMVVRTPQIIKTVFGLDRIMLRMTPPVRMLPLPIDCSPVSHNWISDKLQTKGIYDWEDGILVLADIEKILDGYHRNPQKGR